MCVLFAFCRPGRLHDLSERDPCESVHRLPETAIGRIVPPPGLTPMDS